MMFRRFDDRTRGGIEAALEEARGLGHDSLGDEDLLLGLLRDYSGSAAEALESFGVTLEDAREECEALHAEALERIGVSLEEIRRETGEAFDMRLPEDRRIPLSPRSKEALVGARRRMMDRGDRYLGTEHVLLGVLGVEDGTAVRILERLGVSAEALEERLRLREAG